VSGRWLFERRAMQRRANRIAAKRKRPKKSDNRCTSCGGSETVPALDSAGNSYMGCARCVVVVPPQLRRIVLDLNPLTLVEILDCVSERVNRYKAQGKPVPHMTRVALTMLHEALAIPKVSP
jgi:hypothetical protein